MKLKLLFTLSALLFSGCLGVTDGANYNDQLYADVTVYDAQTGEVLTAEQAYLFHLGQDNVGFGSAFEAKLIGLKEGDTMTIVEKGPTYSEEIAFEAVFGPQSLFTEIPRSDFENFFGTAYVGYTFLPNAESVYEYEITEVSQTMVTFKTVATDGQINFIDSIGANLVTNIDGDQITQSLDPVVGATFVIEEKADGTTELGLPVGSFRTKGGFLGYMEYEYTPVKPNVIGKELRYEVSVIALIESEYVPEEGNFGVRASPVLKGEFSPVADDGHNHVH